MATGLALLGPLKVANLLVLWASWVQIPAPAPPLSFLKPKREW